LEVTSRYGNASGTGWYDVNSTAIATISPLEIQGLRFEGWTGSVSSTSSKVTITMNSEKRVDAQWREAASPTLAADLIIALAVIGIVTGAILLKARRVRLVIGKSMRVVRLRRLLSES
jgi:hypothetical protein